MTERPEPFIFGAWPPEPQGDEMAEQEINWRAIAILGAMAISGISLIIFGIGDWLPWHWLSEIVRELGTAFLIAAVLAFTVDTWLKQGLARDAFAAAMGYLLPSELRQEVRRISGYKVLCTRHHLHIVLKIIDGDTVEVTAMCERVLENISNDVMKQGASVEIDEWGYSERKSEIIECEIQIGGETKKFDPAAIVRSASTVRAETEKSSLQPKETATISWKVVEYMGINDEAIYNFTWPTREPEVQVTAPPELESRAGFRSENKSEPRRYANSVTLNGTYLPPQVMGARWWPKQK